MGGDKVSGPMTRAADQYQHEDLKDKYRPKPREIPDENEDKKSDFALVRFRSLMSLEPYRCKENERIMIVDGGVQIVTLKGFSEKRMR